MAEADRLPQWRVFWRTWYAAEDSLASLPMVVIVPSLTAIGAATWAVAHPVLTVRRGLVVSQHSAWYAVRNGVIGGIVVLLALAGLVFFATWVWYRLLGGDRVWETVYRGRSGQVYFFELRCKENVGKVDPVHLGEVECWIKAPGGRVWKLRPSTEHLATPKSSLELAVGTNLGSGVFAVRWYSRREGERWREIARRRLLLRADEPEIPLRGQAPR